MHDTAVTTPAVGMPWPVASPFRMRPGLARLTPTPEAPPSPLFVRDGLAPVYAARKRAVLQTHHGLSHIGQADPAVLQAIAEAYAAQTGVAISPDARALAEGLSLVVDLRTWDRQLFFAATPGTSADNAEWVRRKINSVRRFQRASYRLVLERGEAPFSVQSGADPADYVIAGGGFPIRVKGAGIIGCLTISGLPGRSDHGVAVAALCDHLGLDRAEYALPAE